ILSSDPPALRALRPELDEALQTVVLKCLEKEPALRYATAAALADDLGHWLRGEPITARPERWGRRWRRSLRRHARWAAVTAVVLCVAAGVLLAPPRNDPDRPLPPM